MRIEELRIGNNIFNHKGEIITVNGIANGYIIIDAEHNILYSLCNPIPLTEEWLIKFGFEKVIYESDETGYGNDYELEIKGVGCISYSDDFSCALFGSKESSKHELGFLPNWDNCKHVHSLQNLYFALTGEELKIKE